MPFPPISTIADAATAVYDWGSQAVNDAVDWTGQAINDAGDWFEQAAKDTGEFFEDVGEGLEEFGEAYVEGWKIIGEELAEGFSKDGWMTQFMEEYVPAGGFVTAAVHAAAGNEEYAQAAAVKGLVTTIEAAASTAGTVALGPAGGILGAGIGNAMGQLVEIAIVDELPPGVQHMFPPKTIEGSLAEIGGAMLGGAAGAAGGKAFGAASRAYKKATMDAAEFAADQAVEKTTAQLVQASLMKKYLLTPTKPAIEAASREAGLPVTDRRLPPPEALERLEVFEQEALASALGAQRHLAELQGATPAELQEYDRQIFSAITMVDELKNDTFTDIGQFEAYYQQGLGVYYMRDGVIVWDESEIPEADKRLDLKRVGMTEEQYEQAIEDQWAERNRLYGAENADWTTYRDDVLGDYMVRGDQVVFGTSDPAEAQQKFAIEEANRRGFATLDEVEDAIKAQWQQRNQLYGEEHADWFAYNDPIMGEYMVKGDQVVFGTTDPDVAEQKNFDERAQTAGWQSAQQYEDAIEAQWADRVRLYGVEHSDWFAYSDPIMGEYMVKGDQIVFGTTDPTRAQDRYATQEAKKQGFDSVDDMRQELVNSWQQAHEYAVESGTATGEWQGGGQSDIVGPYMVKDGVVVFGAETPEQAEELLPTQLAKNRGFDSVDAMKDELVRSWRMSYEHDVEAGTTTGEWQVGGQSDIVGPYMVKDGEVVFGATTPEEAERLLGEQFEIIDEPVLPDEVPVDENGNPIWPEGEDGDEFRPAVMPDDFDSMEPELPDEVPVDENGNPIWPEGEDGDEFRPAVMPDDFDQREPLAGGSPSAAQGGAPLSDDAATIAELRAQLEALQRQVEELTEQLDEPDRQELAEEEEPQDDVDDAPDDDGFDDGFDDFDRLEPELPEEVPINADGTPVEPPDSKPPADDAGDHEMKPAVMPDDPMDWTGTPPAAAEPTPEYVSAVMPDQQGQPPDPGQSTPGDDGFSDGDGGTPPDGQPGEPAEEIVTFEEPTPEPMTEPMTDGMNDGMNDPMANPDEQQNL